MKMIASFAVFGMLFFAIPALAQDAGPLATKQASVTYISGNTVYFDAGSSDGVAEGDEVEIVQGTAVAGRLKVTHVTETKASGTSEDAIPGLQVGDLVRYVPHEAAAPVAPETEGRTLRDLGIGGRVGARWFYLKDRTDLGGSLSQPGVDLRLSGRQVAGAPFDFEIDLRPRRTYSSLGDDSTDKESNRVYQLNGTWRPGPYRLVLGRQSSPSVAPLSLFDGLLLEYRVPRFAVGGFYGTEPDEETWAFSSDVQDGGLFVETGSLPGETTRWSLGGGAVTSTDEGRINRDFVYLTGRVVHGGFFGTFMQEVDINRGWRKDAEDSTFTNSGTFLALRWNATPEWSFSGGFDSRRNVRIYSDRVTPITEFDDDYRQGYWAGAQWLGSGHWLVGVDSRFSRGGSAGDADAYTLNLGALNLTSRGVDVRLRGTQYTGPYIDGTLGSISVSADAGSNLRLEAHAGLRDEKWNGFFKESRTINWYGATADFLLTRMLWATITYDRTEGDDEDNDQFVSSVSWRF